MTIDSGNTHPRPHQKLSISQEQLEELHHKLLPSFTRILVSEDIPVSDPVINQLKKIYIPLAAWCAGNNNTIAEIIGISGAQGSGKSTLTKLLSMVLQEGFHKTVVSLSIDHFYKTQAQRQELANKIHPLLITRGVPGTHDIQLAMSVLSQLINNDKHKTVMVPVFDKATDDREPEEKWTRENCQPDIILFEGWCVGAKAEDPNRSENGLNAPLNELEEKEDTDSSWRNSIDQQLAGPYAELFALINKLVMLKITHFDKVLEWRSLQEDKLRNQSTQKNGHDSKVMTNEKLARFVMHYERITKTMLAEMPSRANVVLLLDDDHQIAEISFNDNPA